MNNKKIVLIIVAIIIVILVLFINLKKDNNKKENISNNNTETVYDTDILEIENDYELEEERVTVIDPITNQKVNIETGKIIE